MSTSEVKNGHFVYRDALFVEVGESKRHPRASVAELQELLLPGRHNASSRDQVGHWYEAQLIHYGLPRSKEKNTAKVRLTNALSSKSLVVPADIRQVESDLKKEYASVLRKAKAAASKDKKSPLQTKRKAEALEGSQGFRSSSTKISVKVGNVTIDIDQQDSLGNTVSTKKQKKTESNSPSTKAPAKPKATSSPRSTNKVPPKTTKSADSRARSTPSAKVKHKVNGVPCYGPDATGVNQWRCEPCRKQSENSFMNSPARRVSLSPFTSSGTGNHPRPKQTARRGKPFNSSVRQSPTTHAHTLRQPTPTSIALDDSDDDPPPPYSRDGYSYDDDASSQNDDGYVQISGKYTIDLSRSYGLTDLEVRLSHDRDQMWGRFMMGQKMGFLRLDGIDGIASSTRKSFGWRTEDYESGRLRFGKGCDGWTEFSGSGLVRGTFHAIDNGKDVDFEGQLEEFFEYGSNEEREEEVEELSTTWHQFPGRAYGDGR